MYEFGDILLFNAFPFSNLGGVKKRPALVLADTGDEDVVVCRVTGEASRDDYDYPIKHWKDCGLFLPSCVRTSKIATLGKQLVLKKLGRLGSPERRNVRSVLKKLLKF